MKGKVWLADRARCARRRDPVGLQGHRRGDGRPGRSRRGPAHAASGSQLQGHLTLGPARQRAGRDTCAGEVLKEGRSVRTGEAAGSIPAAGPVRVATIAVSLTGAAGQAGDSSAPSRPHGHEASAHRRDPEKIRGFESGRYPTVPSHAGDLEISAVSYATRARVRFPLPPPPGQLHRKQRLPCKETAAGSTPAWSTHERAHVAQLGEAPRSDRGQCEFDSRREYRLDEAQLAARRHRKPEVGSSNLSVQTIDRSPCELVEREPHLALNQEDRVRDLGSQHSTMPVRLSRSLKFESVCCADGGSFCLDRVVAGSSPVVVRDVAQSVERQCPPPLGSQTDLYISGQLRRTGFLLWREGPHGLAVRIGTARSPSSLTGPIAHERETTS